MKVMAEVHTDDHVVSVKFDATAFFEQATPKQLKELIAEHYGHGYASDEVYLHLKSSNPELGMVSHYLELKNKQLGDTIGFEVEVEEKGAKAYLSIYWPELL